MPSIAVPMRHSHDYAFDAKFIGNIDDLLQGRYENLQQQGTQFATQSCSTNAEKTNVKFRVNMHVTDSIQAERQR